MPSVSDPTLFNVPSSFTAFVDGGGPYPVSYTAPTADDPDLPGPVPVICDTPSPSNFPYGPTLVTCTATDPNDFSTTSASFTVTVSDVTAPSLLCPRRCQGLDGMFRGIEPLRSALPSRANSPPVAH